MRSSYPLDSIIILKLNDLVTSQSISTKNMSNYGSTSTQNSSYENYKTIEIPLERKSWGRATIFGLVSIVAVTTVLITLTTVTRTDLPKDALLESRDFILKAEASETEFSDSTTTSPTRRSWRIKRQPTVRLSQGRLKGVVLKSRGGREYNAFYTVPYGTPPIGNLRFKPAQPAEGWTGTRDASQKGSMCTQQERYNPNVTIVGSEDCLYVHIFTPKIPRFYEKSTLPVIAYFFGGGFMHGTANDFGGDYFLDEDVIIVLVESRVGAFGFLNTGDLEATGNQGLKDQVLALKWLQDNIAKFGGDSNKVVAFGTSSGAVCSHAHIFSSMSTGLVSGIMSFSGTMLGPQMSLDPNPRESAIKLGEAIGCLDVENSAELVKCLQNAPAEQIGINQIDLTFRPSVETIPDNGDITQSFLTDTPINLLQSGEINKVPWLTGVNSAEAINNAYNLLLDPTRVMALNNNWNEIIPSMLSFQDTSENDIAHAIGEFYFGSELVGNETRYNLTNMISDRIYIHPAKTSALLQAQQNTSVFMYYLTKEANVSYAKDVQQYFEPPYGVSHADEVQYFFPRPRYPFIPLDSEWGEFSKMFVKLIVAFADTSAPAVPTEWPPVDPNGSGMAFYNLDDDPKLIEPVTDRMELWDSFPIDVIYNQTGLPN